MNEVKVHFIPGQGRQGDVLIVPAKQPFAEADLGAAILEQDSNRVVLAHGEVTGEGDELNELRRTVD